MYKMPFFRRKSGKKQPTAAGKSTPSPVVDVPSNHGNPTNLVKANGNVAPDRPPDTDSSQTGSRGASLLLHDDTSHPGDLGISLSDTVNNYKKSSRLSKTLQELMSDRGGIPQLIQFLESCKAGSLIRFWLDADSFQATTWTRIRTHSLNTIGKSSLVRKKETNSSESSYSLDKYVTSPVPNSTSCSTMSSGLESAENNGTNDTNVLPSTTANHCDIASPPCIHLDHENSDGTDKNDGNIPEKGITLTANKDSTKHTVENSNITVGTITTNTEDSRCREKCKSCEKGRFTLALQSCHNQGAQRSENGVQSASSAISCEDITSPSSGYSPGSGVTDGPSIGGGTTKPSTSPTSTTIPKEVLAEKLKKSVEQDAVKIFTKYLAKEATHPVGIPDDLRHATIQKICREDGQLDPECFVPCQEFALNRINEEYYDGFTVSVYHCKHQVDLLTSGKVFLTDVLYQDTALFYFMEYVEREGLSHLLEFVVATDNFEEMLTSQDCYNGQQAQDDAMVLYDKYFSLQAACPLGFPDSIRFTVESNICREEGPLPDCFGKPRCIVLRTIEKLHFPKYLTSDVYYRYLSELVSTVQTAQDFPLGPRKRRGSETSSEHSTGSSRNTLLATGQSRRLQMSKLETNMNNMTIDPGLLNPDMLWRRPDDGKMSLGKIDSLGSFVSNFTPDPDTPEDKKAGASRFFKKKREKEKEQEEMARQVAEKILSDVTSVTAAIGAIKNHPPTTDS